MTGSDETTPDAGRSEQPPRTHEGETKKFKAEVRQILDIVIHSLYTHREIFVRELVSNASDALEKLRHEALVEKDILDRETPYEIRITADGDAHTLTVADSGIGMTRAEAETNLGTIARSGTREFLDRASDRGTLGEELIGKFGVGFYSAFMAGDTVRVRSRSFRPEARGCEWTSDGAGKYTLDDADNLPRGTEVTVALREDAREFGDADTVRRIVRKYSNFVPFPIFVNGERVNTVQAVWEKSPSEVSEDEHKEFFRFIANSDDDPLFRLHITSDAPLQFSALLYIPVVNIEGLGFFRMKPKVNLYSRKVLIVQDAEDLLPEYLRFVAGAVDSVDLPLNISRETLQDNLVFRKLRKFLARRIIRHLTDESKQDPKKFAAFWDAFGRFIKEGTVSDPENRAELAALLRFRSSAVAPDEYVSLDDAASRMKPGQTVIYYLSGRSREEIERGPYLATFARRGCEVLYLFDPIDDFVMTSLGEYGGKKLASADSADIELPPAGEEERPAEPAGDAGPFIAWMKEVLGDAVSDVRESKRILDHPAVVVNPDDGVTASMRRILKAAGQDTGPAAGKVLEVNIAHPLIRSIIRLREGGIDQGFLQTCTRGILDGALAEAGLLEDPRAMVDRMHAVMEHALNPKP